MVTQHDLHQTGNGSDFAKSFESRHYSLDMIKHVLEYEVLGREGFGDFHRNNDQKC
jgi:hypothetical protein